ncbi:MAG: hypothetical protein ACI4NE_00900 [Succinivibrio sp.]
MYKHVLVSALTLYAAACFADVKVAYFPPVPESWNVSIEGHTVVYTSPASKDKNRKSKTPLTTMRFTYSKATSGKDAYEVISEYVKQNKCKAAVEQRKGLFTASCPDISRDIVVIGEVNNLYQIEISGQYNATSMRVINEYINNIVSGKMTFVDREIGEAKPRLSSN